MTDDHGVHWGDEQRFVFDLKGWVALPGVLSGEELASCRAYLDQIQDDPEATDPLYRNRPGLGGPLQELLDHPVLVDVMRDIIGPDVEDQAYGFRVESSFLYRLPANPDRKPVHAHRGTNLVPSPHGYQYADGRIYSGQTRAVWELNGVDERGGGTRFLSGSHKANFEVPDRLKAPDSPLWESYTCPPGTLLVFCERVMHTGAVWTNLDWPRMSVFTCYNHLNCQVHKMNVTHEQVMAMPEKRRTLFRGVWDWWNRGAEGSTKNNWYGEDNRCL